MANSQIVRRRIHSIRNAARICKATEMIATARMKRAQEQATAGRPYADKIRQVVSDLALQPGDNGDIHPLLQRRDATKIAIIHITTDHGLCGGLNANQNHLVASSILEQSVPVTLIVIGRKGKGFARTTRRDTYAVFTGISDSPRLQETLPISRAIINGYSKGDFDLVYLVYPRFTSTIKQTPVMEILLPVKPPPSPTPQAREYLYEPLPDVVLAELLPRFVEMQIYHAILELKACEQSARMVAMRDASDNAHELTQSLTMTLHRLRQENITREICDISGGAESGGSDELYEGR